jgi:hypothetical protein
MKHRNNLKIIIKNLIITLVVFSMLVCVLGIEQTGYVAGHDYIERNLIDEDRWYKVRNDNKSDAFKEADNVLIVYDNKNKDSIELKNNVQFVLNSVFVKTELLNIGLKGDISLKSFSTVFVCVEKLNLLPFNNEIAKEYVQNGGHIVFADGFEKGPMLPQWAEILGIINENETFEKKITSLKFTTDLMAGAEGKEFSDDVINGVGIVAEVAENCVVHAVTCDEKPMPVLWENNIGSGKIMVCNAEIMNSKTDRGLLVSVYSRLYPAFAYPVINSAVYCIDDCPSPAPAEYDKNVFSQYGYTVKDFYFNVWMPSLQKLHKKYGVKYSSFAIETYENKNFGPFKNEDDKPTARYYAGQILNMGGEVGIHGYNHQPLVLKGYMFDKENKGYTPWPDVHTMIKSIEQSVKYTESLTDELEVQAYVAPSNVIGNEALKEMQASFEDIRVYAGIYSGTEDQFIQEFQTLKNGTVYCPRLTADMQMEDSEWWTQINELNYHFVASNFIHPDDILDEERNDGGDFNQMLDGYTQMIKWNQKRGLRNATISECGGAVQRYDNLALTQKLSNNSIKLHCEGLIDEAFVMIKTNGKRLVGGEDIIQTGESAYVVRITDKDTEYKLVNN